jgi:hypothetical protein
MTHYQQLERFAQDDKWEKLKADLERGEPTDTDEMIDVLDDVIHKAKMFKNFLRKRNDDLKMRESACSVK